MVHTPNPLWERIERFQTDEPGRQFPFSLKLAREQGWSPRFSQRAISEYKRFVYLCCVLPRGASPPPVVDAVWHLHLTYTRNYWLDFCPNCLGRDLHHDPSAGGMEDEQRHRDWYLETLSAYEQIFDQPPPRDIWPPPPQTAAPNNPERLPKPGIALPMVIAGALAMLPAYALSGPAFLLCFALFLIWCGIIRWVHYKKCGTIVGRELFRNSALLKLPELAFIAGNKQRIRQLVIADGIDRNILSQQDSRWRIDQALLLHERPFYADWFPGIDQIDEPDLLSRIDLAAEAYAAPYRPLAVWLNENSFPKSVLTVPAMLGGARMIQGLSNGRPVGFLILEFVMYVLILRGTRPADRFHVRMAGAMKDDMELLGSLMQCGIAGLVILDGMRTLAMWPEFQPLSPTLLAEWAEPRLLNGTDESPGFGSGCSGSSCSGSCGGGCGGCGGGD